MRARPRRPWRRRLTIGCGVVLLLIGSIALWLGLQVREMKAPVVVDGVHPFRSAAARDRYLAHYEEWAQLWPVSSTVVFVDTSWGETFVRINGPTDGPPLVLLPGANSSSLLWQPNIEALSGRYRVYAVDNVYDVGRSVYARHLTKTEDFIDWLDDLFDGLGLGRDVNLLGLSYGGWIAAEYGLARPERLRTVTLVAPAATVAWLSDDFITKGLLCLIPHPHFVKSMVRWALHDAAEGTPEQRQVVEEAADSAWLGLRCFKLKQMVPPRVLTDEQWRSFEMPVLFLAGENEVIYAITGEEAVGRVRRVAPEIETELFPNCGHDLSFVQVERFSIRVLEFLDRHAGEFSECPALVGVL